MRTILYLPCFDYFNHRQRSQHLLWELSKLGFHVIYCNVTKYAPDFIPLSPTFALCNNINANNINALDYKKEYIMWLTHGPHADLLPHFRLQLVVSDFADASVDEFAAYAVYDQKKIDAADIVTAASEKIFQWLSKKHSNSYLIKNGADLELFQKSLPKKGRLPGGLSEIGLNRPIIGFWGALSSWIDFALLSYAADLRQDFNFVLVGGCNMAVSLLPRRKNIHYLGPRDYETLPAYARCFDAAILPFQVKPVTLAADPIKVYEYLACGLPVVSSNLPQLQGVADVKPAGDYEEFVRFLDWAVYDGRSEDQIRMRLDYASRNTWQKRAGTLAGVLREAATRR